MASRKTDSTALYAFDEQLRAQHGVLCGVDEAGRGPLCGPVCCAAVILDPANPVEGVNDSKKLSAKRREELYEEITQKALAWKVIFVPPEEIDEKNILWATMDGMAQAVAGLEPAPAYADRGRQPLSARSIPAGKNGGQGGCQQRIHRSGIHFGEGEP